MNSRQPIYWIIPILALVGAVFYLGWEEVITTLGRANPLFMIFLFLLQIFSSLLVAYRWHYLLQKKHHTLPLTTIYAITMTGSFVENATPSSRLGGEATKMYLFHRYTSHSYSDLAGITLCLKYFSLMPLLIIISIFLIPGIMRFDMPPITYVAFAFLVAFVSLLAFIYHRGGKNEESRNNSEEIPSSKNDFTPKRTSLFSLNNFSSFIKEKYQAISNFTRQASIHSRNIITTGDRVILILISIFIWGLYPLKVYLVVTMLGFGLDIFTIAIVSFSAYLVSLLPLSPGGLGLFEGSMVFMFALVGISPPQGLAIALLSRLVIYWFPLLISAISASILAMKNEELLLAKEDADLQNNF